MTVFDVKYLYLFLNASLIYIKGILQGLLPIPVKKKKAIFIQKIYKNIFVFIYLLKKSSYQKTRISNSYLVKKILIP
jgi:hypothetical protein